MLSINNDPQFQVMVIKLLFYLLYSDTKTQTQGSGGSWGIIPNSGSTKYFLVLDPMKIPCASSLASNTRINFSSARTNPVGFVLISSSHSFLMQCHLPPPTNC